MKLFKRIYFLTRTRSAGQRWCTAVALVAFAASCISFGSAAFAQEVGDRWAAIWAASPTGGDDKPLPTLNNQSVRQIARVAFAGTGGTLRVQLTNELGGEAVFVGDARIALAGSDGSILPLFNYPLTFDGKTSVTIRPGPPVLSDPVKIAGRGALPPPGFWRVAVSLYFPQSVTVETMHALGLQTAYITNDDTTADTHVNNPEVSQSRYFLSRIEAVTGREGIVALGDSITDGAGSSVDANRRWPDDLVNRLFQCSFCPPLKVVSNEGISGNGVLNFGFGPSALTRFDRDVLSTPGARYLVVLEGINDIGNNDPNTIGNDLIAGYRQLIRRGHSSGLYVYGGTLTPIGGSLYDSPEHEAVRQAVNDWIRNSGEFDAAIDFDAAVRDPAASTRLLARYDSGDHLHPNDAGYQAMANAIDLRLFGLGRP